MLVSLKCLTCPQSRRLWLFLPRGVAAGREWAIADISRPLWSKVSAPLLDVVVMPVGLTCWEAPLTLLVVLICFVSPSSVSASLCVRRRDPLRKDCFAVNTFDFLDHGGEVRLRVLDPGLLKILWHEALSKRKPCGLHQLPRELRAAVLVE